MARTLLAIFRSILFTIAFYGGSVFIVIIAFIILPFSRHRLQSMARG